MRYASVDIPLFCVHELLRVVEQRVNDPLLQDDGTERPSKFAFDVAPRERRSISRRVCQMDDDTGSADLKIPLTGLLDE